MAKQFYEFRIKARPRWNRRKPKDRRDVEQLVIARSRHDAKLVFLDHFPQFVLLECTRGPKADSPTLGNTQWSRGHLLNARARKKRSS